MSTKRNGQAVTVAETVTILPSAIRNAWTEIQAGRNPIPCQSALSAYVDGKNPIYRSQTVNTFTGTSGPEMSDRLVFGYVPKNEPKISAMNGAEMFSPRIVMGEEGQFIYGEMAAGEEFYHAYREDLPSKAGITVRANIAFNAGTNATGISDYLDWILAVIDEAGRQSIPCDLELVIRTKNSYEEMPGKIIDILIPVMQAGTVMDAASWRAFLAPGAFRSLGFLSMGLAGKDKGRKLVKGLGYAIGEDWNVTFSGDNGILDIDVPNNPYGAFPADDMSSKVQAAFDSC